MKCEKGDIAKIIMSLRPSNIGKTVFVEEYIGYLKQGEEFQSEGVLCKAQITDHYWWIVADYGLKNMNGSASRVYIPDSWLEPIRPEKEFETRSVEEDLTEKV
jgi:hypothetical protein